MTSAGPQFVYVLPDGVKGATGAAMAHYLLPGSTAPAGLGDVGGLPAGLVFPQMLGVTAQGALQHAGGALAFGAPHLLALGHHTGAGAAPQRRGDSTDARKHDARSSREGGASRNGSRALPDEDAPGASSSDDPAGEQQPGGKRARGQEGIKEKNREAQRRFRARQKVLISGLKENMESMQTRVAKQEQELTCLREENAVLRQLLASAQQAAAAAAIAAAAGNNNNNNNGGNTNAPAAPPANGHAPAPASGGVALDGMALMQRLDSAGLGMGGPTIFLHPMAGAVGAHPQAAYLPLLHAQQLLNVVVPVAPATRSAAADTSVGTAPAPAAVPAEQPQRSNSGKAATTGGGVSS